MEYKTLGDWCKFLEKNFSNDIMIPTLPVIIRLDGNNFHNWTKGLKKPFDKNLTDLMIETTKFLVNETNAIIGYTQSDEITLILYTSDKKSALYNDGKKQKIISKLTANCVNYFNEKRKELLPDHNKIAVFDCRIYQVPTLHDACIQLLWRELDATRNSIQCLAQSNFSHKSLQNLNCSLLQDKLLKEKNINWNELEDRYKRGVYVRKVHYTNDINAQNLSAEEISKLPLKHNILTSKCCIYTRTSVEILNLPIFNKIQNKVEVIFNSATPILKENNE